MTWNHLQGWMRLKFCKALVTRYVLPGHKNFFPFGLSILVLEYPRGIIHQQLVAMLRGHVRFVYMETRLNEEHETRQKPEKLRYLNMHQLGDLANALTTKENAV